MLIDDEEYARQVAREHAEWTTIEAAAAEFAEAISRSPQAWILGNGNGGAVMALLTNALAERGVWAADLHDFRPRTRVESLARRDGWDCHYCGAALGWGHPSVTRPEVEHVIPRSRGGTDRLDNLVLSCGPCNRAKGTMTASEFAVWVAFG